MGNVVMKDQFEEITFTVEHPGSENCLNKRATVSVYLLLLFLRLYLLIFRGGRKEKEKGEKH